MSNIKKVVTTLMTLAIFIMPTLAQEDGDPVSIGKY